MTTRIQLRRDTAANWTNNNPVLASAEVGVETDTGKFKIGDDTTAWTSLGYSTTDLSGVVLQSVVDAKGDLLVGSSNDTVTKLTVGTDNYVLTADSTAINGIAWKAGSTTSLAKTIAWGND